MSSETGNTGSKVEQGFFQALIALDNQVAREMQRDPAKVAEQGVQKWEPIEKRVEAITELLLDGIDQGKIQLDSILIASQAFAHALTMLCDELGNDGLGELRSEYCRAAFEKILRHAEQGGRGLRAQRDLN